MFAKTVALVPNFLLYSVRKVDSLIVVYTDLKGTHENRVESGDTLLQEF